MAIIIYGNEMNIIGNNVRKYRRLRNMRQQKLSDRLELLGYMFA